MHESHVSRTFCVRQSHCPVRGEFRTMDAMDTDDIVSALKRLDINHDEIAAVIGRDRTAATKMLSGKRNVQAKEIEPLRALIFRHEQEHGNGVDVSRLDYVAVDVLPTSAGAGGGGTGEGEARKALIAGALVRELGARAKDLVVVPIRGDSMEPDFYGGDQVLIDRRDRDTSQPGAFALWDDDGYVLKLVERVPHKRGWLRIFSANPRYSAYEIEEQEATIMGRPVWVARRVS